MYYIYYILFSVEYALKLMKRAWRDGTAPTRTLDVPDFVERHVHENFAVSMGPKPLPRHKHLEGTKSPLIVRNPPHHVHKSLNLNKSSMGTEGGDATSNHIKIKGRRAVKKDNKLQHHPYAYAAKHAKRQGGGLGFGDDNNDGDTNDDMSPSPLFTKAGIIGTPEFDSYDKYRLDIFPCKEALKHEVNKLVLEKQKLDRINQQLRDERRRQLLEERMRGGSGRRRTRHVQQQELEDNETSTTEGDDEEDSSDDDENNDDTCTSTDTTEEYDANEEEEINDDDDEQ